MFFGAEESFPNIFYSTVAHSTLSKFSNHQRFSQTEKFVSPVKHMTRWMDYGKQKLFTIKERQKKYQVIRT